MTRSRRQRWSHQVGPYGCRVSVFEEVNGVIYARESGAGPRSLGHRSRERAKVWARERQARLALGLEDANSPAPTVRRVIELYMAHHSPVRTSTTRAEDRRRQELWEAVLGSTKDLDKLTRGEWERFARERATGAIDGRGRSVPYAIRRSVRARTVGGDQEWLRSVILWAMTWQDAEGRYVMRENPSGGMRLPGRRTPSGPWSRRIASRLYALPQMGSRWRYAATVAVSRCDHICRRFWTSRTEQVAASPPSSLCSSLI